jgi:hypothetical protein
MLSRVFTGKAHDVGVQVDFAPTLAAVLGVPIPFGNIGRISRELWELRGNVAGYQAALAVNARQARRFLRCPVHMRSVLP